MNCEIALLYLVSVIGKQLIRMPHFAVCKAKTGDIARAVSKRFVLSVTITATSISCGCSECAAEPNRINSMTSLVTARMSRFSSDRMMSIPTIGGIGCTGSLHESQLIRSQSVLQDSKLQDECRWWLTSFDPARQTKARTSGPYSFRLHVRDRFLKAGSDQSASRPNQSNSPSVQRLQRHTHRRVTRVALIPDPAFIDEGRCLAAFQLGLADEEM